MNQADAVTAKLLELQTCTVGDVLDEMGLPHQVLSQELVALDRSMKVAGPAFCIRGHSAPASSLEAEGGGTKVGFEMFRNMYPGCVVVMDTGGHYLGGPWGENSALSAKARGSIGVVMDGATRDSLELIEMGWPTFSRRVTPARVEGRWTQIAFEEPVALPGQTSHEVAVHPGDYVLADADGVVIVPRDIVDDVIQAAVAATEAETQMRLELIRGDDREEVYARHDRFAVARKLRVRA